MKQSTSSHSGDDCIFRTNGLRKLIKTKSYLLRVWMRYFEPLMISFRIKAVAGCHCCLKYEKSIISRRTHFELVRRRALHSSASERLLQQQSGGRTRSVNIRLRNMLLVGLLIFTMLRCFIVGGPHCALAARLLIPLLHMVLYHRQRTERLEEA